MQKQQFYALSLIIFSACFFSKLSFAAEDLVAAQRVIEKSATQIQDNLKLPIYQNDFNKAANFVDGVVSQFVDMPRVSLLVLGNNIRKASPDQRQQFMNEFKKLLVRTYTQAFLEYKEWRISFMPNNDSKDDGRTIVRAQVIQPGKQPVNISYRMILNKKGEWKVYDIMIEGISLITNYRTTFNQEIAQTGSIDGVIQSLVDKNNRSRLN
ncbi:phospholipid-binding protein MlaC [Methylicorpusculum sp.]|uniref:MlaC/ttg2D family ABC transporter substrate-binding protein n=1 Tax=Methylicorpusculum sp. TaxID=2713644 RepID=UPI00273099F9|nr:ABC transporter substrate-binding protein [Methylicorpusculum sp.]MDP2179536.1 ABC transporter substrate-binding protein [Methylicorpusculum sp.]MDP3529789.1 ABC transporter substrate-binding protein [Methylicorpusculum sp.]